jgi:hypothetical protein
MEKPIGVNKLLKTNRKISAGFICQAILTSNLDELETPKNEEFLQRTGYPRGQEFEALKASQCQEG